MYGFYQNKLVWPWRHTIKILLMIKLTTILLFITMLQVSAATLAQKVSLNVKDAPLERIFDSIRDQCGVDFFFSASLMAKAKLVNVHIKDQELNTALAEIFREQPLSYVIKNNSVQVRVKEYSKLAKPGRVSGKIVDEKGETLPGASVKVVETGAGAQAGADGSYILNLQPGTYTLEFSYISFATQRVTGVVVTEGKNTPLDISLKTDSRGLKEVVVTSGYKKASTEGLLVKQKNASEISNGISAEQIARTPDRNIGESLKRISGVSSVDNKFVLVRGIGERYNAAMLDGVVLPSTEAQSRSFSFDMIPSNMVDNVVVSKTVTPDMNANFGGGLIQVNTKDIPNENFMSFTAGTSYNDQATGKEFLSHKRGKYDYFGFDDGRRDYPKNLVIADRRENPENLSPETIQKKFDDQSKRFTNDNFTVYKYKAAPSQNYQFSLGRLFALDNLNKNKFGFTGSLTYRNTQTINVIDNQNRGDWYLETDNAGKAYGFNTTLGGLLNAGLQLGKNRFTLRNTYTHMYDNVLVRNIGYDNVQGPGDVDANRIPNRIREADDPTYTDLLQNKLSGLHQLGKTKIEWNVARAGINRQEKDLVLANSGPVLVNNDYQYFYSVGSFSQPQIENNMSRHHYENSETHYSWDVAATVPFMLAGSKNTLKTGYYGNRKKADFNWQIAALNGGIDTKDSLRLLPVGEMIKPENMGKNRFGYSVASYWLDRYKGKSQNDAFYTMLDNRFTDQLRLVWGIRADYYKYTEIENPPSNIGGGEFEPKKDKAWQWLPSANLTYSPTKQINIRAAFSSSVVRPELLENSQFARWSPYLEAQLDNYGLYSTRIDSYDFKTEWFPGLGEIISAGVFYKKFDKPAELTFNIATGNNRYYFTNADNAKVYGLELEIRKNFGLLFGEKVLKDFTFYGNLTLQKSSVIATFKQTNPDKSPGAPQQIDVKAKQDRPMYGQAPYLINLGLQYTGERLGFNVAYNKSGYKTYVVSFDPGIIEYERPREQLDAQVSYRFLKKKLEIKFNAGNLLNAVSSFYINQNNYDKNPDYDLTKGDKSDAFKLKSGYSAKYEEGDMLRFTQRFGRTYSTSLTYNF